MLHLHLSVKVKYCGQHETAIGQSAVIYQNTNDNNRYLISSIFTCSNSIIIIPWNVWLWTVNHHNMMLTLLLALPSCWADTIHLHIHEPYRSSFSKGSAAKFGVKPFVVLWFPDVAKRICTKGRDSNMFIVLKGEAWQLRMTPWSIKSVKRTCVRLCLFDRVKNSIVLWVVRTMCESLNAFVSQNGDFTMNLKSFQQDWN